MYVYSSCRIVYLMYLAVTQHAIKVKKSEHSNEGYQTQNIRTGSPALNRCTGDRLTAAYVLHAIRPVLKIEVLQLAKKYRPGFGRIARFRTSLPSGHQEFFELPKAF
jgi:hypothetical protein